MPIIDGVWRPHDWRDWEVDLVDSSWDIVDAVQEAVSLSVKWAKYGNGDGSFSIHIESRLAEDLLSEGMWHFRFHRDGVHLFDKSLSNDDRGYDLSKAWDDEYIKIKLMPIEMMFKDKFCSPDLSGTDPFQTPSLPVDDGFKWIVDHAVGPNAYDGPGSSSRSISGLSVASYTSEHATTQAIHEFHKVDLYEGLQKYGAYWGVDWRVRLIKGSGNACTPTFQTFVPARGLDKTEDNGSRMPIILNDASGEVIKAERHLSRVGFANVVIAKNFSSEVMDATSVAAYGRREFIAETSEIDEMNAILDQRKQRVGDGVTFAESEMVEIGTETWQIQPGDTVRVGNVRMGVVHHDAEVREIEFKLDKGGFEKPRIVFGEYKKTLKDKTSSSGRGPGSNGFYDPMLGIKVGSDVAHFDFDDPSTVEFVAGVGIDLSIASDQVTVKVGGATAQWQALVSGADPFTAAWTTLLDDVSGATKEAALKSDGTGKLTLTHLSVLTNTFLTSGYLFSNNEFKLFTNAAAAQVLRCKGLQVGSSYSGTIPTDGILFGADVNLYRSATNALKTDDDLIVAGDLQIPTSAKGIIFNVNTSGMVVGADGDRFRPKTPSITGNTDYDAAGEANWSIVDSATTGSGTALYVWSYLSGESPAYAVWRPAYAKWVQHRHADGTLALTLT